MSKKPIPILFLGKSDDDRAQRALNFCRDHFTGVVSQLGRFGQGPLPENTSGWTGDYIISYLSPWVIPESLLKRAAKAALNFHPASPDYPGIGCNNFALYENAREYGVTCHHMASHVDTGRIIAARRFEVFETDNVASLLSRTHDHLLSLFYDIGSLIASGKTLPESKETWTRRPFTRKQLDELARITREMSRDEIARRIRATAFDSWKPIVDLHGFVFELKTSGHA